ncbi:outer membrane beta-barrel protein [Mucilaginibacter flavus]|uniref:outer membrane beta-barrel protein n=1 Tax=Mucilaginibacter flavus TaxID=931504 RepID=UPI0025B46911|nr:outer membrane beta-barrel protein [Mucilaginibacter flavus]MDN3582240.1 outer membrane beta-barrel protein [Mucilaginibacter flavus]
MIKKWIVLLITIWSVKNSYAQTESFMSKIYFPGAVGVSIPFGGLDESVKRGLMLNTALEVRPTAGDALFYRFNYDAITNHYQQVYSNSPTNVNNGKLSSSIFSLGVGYRKKAGLVKLFALLQPGIAINSYDKVTDKDGAITINQVTRRHFSMKLSGGIEYYLAEHFALTFEPSYFYLSPRNSYKLLNPQSVNFSFGFTTTLF